MKLDGKPIEIPSELEAPEREARPGGVVILKEPQSGRRLRAHWITRGEKTYFQIQGFHGTLEKPRKKEYGAESDAEGDGQLVAQFPGKVLKVLVKEGQVVKEGADLLIVEAMKMEFSIKASKGGKVKKIFMKEGEPITIGNRFLDIENEPEEKCGDSN